VYNSFEKSLHFTQSCTYSFETQKLGESPQPQGRGDSVDTGYISE